MYKTKFLNECIVLDTETSNYNIEEAEIIEIAFGMHSDGDWITQAEQFMPLNGITAQAKSCSWITESDLEGKPSYYDGYDSIEPFLSVNGYKIAHNAPYDRDVINMNADRYGLAREVAISNNENWICTLKLARKLYKDESFPEFKLGFLWFHLGLDQLSTRKIIPHRADSDIYMTGKLLDHLIDELIAVGEINNTSAIGPQLYAYQEAPIYLTAFPFGKHKGVDPKDVPDSYYVWLIGNSDSLKEDNRNFDKNLAHTVEIIMSERLGE